MSEGDEPRASAIPPVGRGHRIPSLDGLRAVSILLVIGFHGLNSVSQKTSHDDYHGLWLMLLSGNLGVSIFFVISGFLITRLLLREIDETGTVRLTDFYLRRTFRIWPAFYTYLLAVIVLHKLRFIGIAAKDVIAAATFSLNYVPHVGNWWVGHSWSLSVEEQFYLFWPAVLLMVGPRRAVWVAVGLLVFAPVARFLEIVLLPWNNMWVERIWMTTHTRVDTLMYGCLLALLWKSPRLQSAIGFCREKWLAVPALLVATVGSYLLVYHTKPVLFCTTQYTFEGIAITVVIALLVTGENTPAGRVFNSRPMVHIGRISFSLYLWQQLFMTCLNTSWSGRFPFDLICSFAAAEISYHLIEQPALALRGKWFARPKTPGPIAVVAARVG